jgi:PAS domain S-box-containing protein
MVRDITARKQSALTQARLAAIVESSEEAIVGKDISGTILAWNTGAARIFGYTAEEIIGRSILTIVPPELAHEEADILSRLACGERLQNFETIRVRKNGERFPVSLTISPIRDEHGSVVGASKIAHDITDRKRIEREREDLLRREQMARSQAEEASRIKDEFLATVSHELRAPLSAISGWTHVLGSASLKDSDRARAVEAIQRGVQSQTQLINDLLDVSRIVAGKMRLDIRILKLVEVLEQTIDTIRPAAEAKRVRLQVVLDPAADPLSGDSDRLQQVFWNLLSNAIKFTPSGGRVALRSERINSHIEITVSDTGIGIRAEVLPYVFERFRQADSAITRKFGGLGLGLAIVRHLVELHGGTVSADSAGENQGATFIVRLPAAPTTHLLQDQNRVHPAAGGATPGGAPQLESLRLLVVDDDSGTREVMQAILERAGAEVRTADSAAATLKILDEWQPDVLLSDIGMPVVDGYGLIREVRARPASRGGRVPAAALTAYSRTEDRLRALSAGFQMHLAKPVEPIELITVVASLAHRF